MTENRLMRAGLCFGNAALAGIFAYVYFVLARAFKTVALDVPEVAEFQHWDALSDLCAYSFGGGVVIAVAAAYLGARQLTGYRP